MGDFAVASAAGALTRAGYALAASMLGGAAAGAAVWRLAPLPEELRIAAGVTVFSVLAVSGAVVFRRKVVRAVSAAVEESAAADRAEVEELRAALEASAREALDLRRRLDELDFDAVLEALDGKVRAVRQAAEGLRGQKDSRLAELEKENADLREKLQRAMSALKGEL
ncbi:hypothetical protein [Desulfofundulus thermosubterraneus]|uniref:Uncharacterized protein n=1 Tax=Desulfofundulus thermosubterraneus DSM 16057 TaxID=1121432 RepID=A0A1M6J9V1_9FIRM|nr:hypothetical protein [Desulfofundulus thermosubterraneus]SHJ43451.1 hypothetical protein SAMN02745219_02548 [Desulfofundulus thermosubterraneus DSM 16057]